MQLLNDIKNYSDLSEKRKIFLISFLTAISSILSVLDTMIPKPIPFIKIGLANIVSLILVKEERLSIGLQVTLLRVLISSLMIGTFLSYTFLLSFSGAIGSLLLMSLFFKLCKNQISEIGISVIGAFFNVAFQGIVVILFYGYDSGTLFFISMMIMLSLVNGIVIGFLAKLFYKKVYTSSL